MGLDTLDGYRIEAESEKPGWRGATGRLLTFAGFVVLANAFLVAMLFRHILSFRAQILSALAGGTVGVVGMIIRGNRRDQINVAAISFGCLVLTMIVVAMIEERFGWLGLVIFVLVFGWLVQRLEERSWKNL